MKDANSAKIGAGTKAKMKQHKSHVRKVASELFN